MYTQTRKRTQARRYAHANIHTNAHSLHTNTHTHTHTHTQPHTHTKTNVHRLDDFFIHTISILDQNYLVLDIVYKTKKKSCLGLLDRP